MRPFIQSNPSIWSLLSWHPTHTHPWVRFSVFSNFFVSTVTVPPRDSDYVNRSASLQQFRLIHQRRARRLCSDKGGALDCFMQALPGAAEHKQRSRAGKILTTVVESPSKSVSCWWGSPSAVFLIFVCSYLLESKLRIRDEELQAAVSDWNSLPAGDSMRVGYDAHAIILYWCF